MRPHLGSCRDPTCAQAPTPFYLGLNSAVIHRSFIPSCPQCEDVYFLRKKPFYREEYMLIKWNLENAQSLEVLMLQVSAQSRDSDCDTFSLLLQTPPFARAAVSIQALLVGSAACPQGPSPGYPEAPRARGVRGPQP